MGVPVLPVVPHGLALLHSLRPRLRTLGLWPFLPCRLLHQNLMRLLRPPRSLHLVRVLPDLLLRLRARHLPRVRLAPRVLPPRLLTTRLLLLLLTTRLVRVVRLNRNLHARETRRRHRCPPRKLPPISATPNPPGSSPTNPNWFFSSCDALCETRIQ